MSNYTAPLGFVHALQLNGSGGSNALLWQAIESQSHNIENLWIHCNFEDNDIQEWLRNKAHLDPLLTEALIDEDTRPRVAFFKQGILLVLRGVNKNVGNELEDMVSIRIWVEPNRILSVSKKPLASVGEIRSELKKISGPLSIPELVITLCDRLEWHVSQLIDEYSEKIDQIESHDIDQYSPILRKTLATLRRRVVMPRRHLSPQRDALSRLVAEAPVWFEQQSILRLKEISNRLQRHLEDLDAIRDRTVIAQEEIQAHLSDQLNARMYMLNIIAAIFLPLSFLTGLFGINLAGIPGASYQYAFYLFSSITLFIGVSIILLFYWKRWF